MKKVGLLITALVISIGAFAKSDVCYLHLDKSFYVNGEIVWFKAYLPTTFNDRPKSIKMILVNPDNDVVYSTFLRTDGKTFVDGYYQIPFDIAPANYRLAIFGKTTSGSNIVLAHTQFPIYNDFETFPANSATSQFNGSTQLPSDLNVSIDLGIANPARRTLVQCTIKTTGQNGGPVASNISIAINDVTLTSGQNVTSGNDIDGLQVLEIQNNASVSGILSKDNGYPFQTNILAAFIPRQNLVIGTKSNSDGWFHLNLNDWTGAESLQFVRPRDETNNLLVTLDDGIALPAAQPLAYSQEVIDYLNLSKMRKKIFQYQGNLESQLQIEVKRITAREVEPDFTYEIAEYESFELMKDFFGELLTPLKFKAEEEVYSATMTNPSGRISKNTDLSGHPLFIVDGKATWDADYAAHFSMVPIETVDLFFDPYNLRKAYSVIGRSGVVRINTRLPEVTLPEEDEEDIFQINGYQPTVTFPEFIPETLDGDHQPFFRPQLYWNPNVQADNGNATFSFYQSDDVSTFRITVVAQAADGSMGMETLDYQVRR